MRIAFCAIVYDRDGDHKQLEALIASAEKVGYTDWVFGVDTKSAVGTEEWLRRRLPAADVFSFEWRDDFAWARNLTLARVPKECTWWSWADSDDTIEMLSGRTVQEIVGALPEKDRTGKPLVGVFFDYDYARDEHGNSTTMHLKGRLYRNDVRWEWRNRVHEDCYPLDGDFGVTLAVIVNEEDLLWVHHIEDRPSSYTRNMRILRQMLEDDPHEARTWYYLGNQCFAQHEWLKATEAYERYVDMSGWTQEKWTALIYQGISYQQLEMFDKAIGSYTRAMLLLPELPDSYFGLGEVHTRLGDWEKGRYFGEWGLQRVAAGTLPDKTVFFNANAYQFTPYLWLADCYWNLDEQAAALIALEQAAKARPDKDLLQKIELVKWTMARDRITKNGIDLAAGLIRRNEPLKAKAILDNLPAGASERSDVRQAKAITAREVAHLYDDVGYRNFYFRSELEEGGADPLKWLDVPNAGVPRFAWTREVLQRAGAKKVLQVGIGNGIEGIWLAKYAGIQVVGIDINALAVKEANWTAVKAGIIQSKVHRIATDEEAAEEGIEPTIETPDLTPDAMFQAYYSDVRKIDEKVLALGPFDAVLASELIEHVPDVGELLSTLDKLAPRVLITTPDGTFDGPQIRNKDHVRAYSVRELASALNPHGAVTDLHVLNNNNPGIADNIVAQYLPGAVFTGDQVVIYCGNTGQGWSPDSLHQGGIGGSETAVIRVAEELATRGKRVKVWAECQGIWNGVSYSYAEDFVPWDCDLYVSWRSMTHQGTMKPRAARRFVWAHDVHFGEATAEQLEGVTVLALSEWHRGFLAERYPTADIVVSGNGIDPERFDADVERIPHRLIYAQSPDRGLDVVLRMFPEIRAHYPDATLDVFYGFDLARQRIPQFIALLEEELGKQPGVTFHGRIDQDQLAREYLKADALIYPATMPDGRPFDETYCISVVEALAAGCFPITADHGALRETNRGGAFCRASTFEKDALFQLFEFWRRPLKEQRNIRDHGNADKYDPRMELSGRRWAVEQTWSRIAEQWIALCTAETMVAA